MPKLDEDASDVSGVGAILATEIKSGMITSKIHFLYQDHACVMQIYESAVSLACNYISLIFPSPQRETKLHAL